MISTLIRECSADTPYLLQVVRQTTSRLRKVAPLTVVVIAITVSCGGTHGVAPSDLPIAVTLVGAGDIADCSSPRAAVTAGLLDSIPGTVFTAGDHAYPDGTVQQFRDCYAPTWGRHRARTKPSPGNHDYEQSGAAPYFEYFGQNAGPSGLGYYRFRLGAWEVYSLNSNVGLDEHSAQFQWLRRQLSASEVQCTVVIWHHPLFSSGPNGMSGIAQPLWRMLQEFGVDIVINGHEHLYERFAPQDANGRADPVRGIRQFIVGTGGAPLASATRLAANSEVRLSEYGVLRLTLATGYTWNFVTSGSRISDSGSGTCR